MYFRGETNTLSFFDYAKKHMNLENATNIVIAG